MQLVVTRSGLTLGTGVAVALALSILYVGVIYTHTPKEAVQSSNGIVDRNHPALVRFRIKAITAFTLTVLCVLPVVLSVLANAPLSVVYAELGVFPGLIYDNVATFSVASLIHFVLDILKALLLVVVLFIGPLLDSIVNSPSPLTIINNFAEEVITVQGIRDLIVAPITEEIIYTSSIITILYQIPGISMNVLIYVPPLFFSVAHIHHARGLYKRSIPLSTIIISTLFQMLYTFLFGIFTDFVFLRQNNIWSCIAAHSFCNFMGPPSFSVDSNYKNWKYVYHALLIIGIYGFGQLLLPLTESPLGLRSWL